MPAGHTSACADEFRQTDRCATVPAAELGSSIHLSVFESPPVLSTQAKLAAELMARMAASPLQQAVILNVNVPDLPDDELRGVKVTRLGNRHRSEPAVRAQDPRGRDVYWVGSAGAGQDAGPGTDFHAIASGYASITPLQIDLTRHAAIPELERWLQRE